tara:strand:- start:133 stop:441 length:309 start_codon:yes stop_codon:yes gene_type:complete
LREQLHPILEKAFKIVGNKFDNLDILQRSPTAIRNMPGKGQMNELEIAANFNIVRSGQCTSPTSIPQLRTAGTADRKCELTNESKTKIIKSENWKFWEHKIE